MGEVSRTATGPGASAERSGARSPKTASGVEARDEWRHPLAGISLGLLSFELVTGLAIYLLPFSVFNQFAVLVHTVLGVGMLIPVLWYLVRHWRRRFRGNLSHYQLLGYAAGVALLVLVVTGVVLTWQALFGRRIDYGWDLVHVVATFVLLAALGAHLATILWRRSKNAAVRGALAAARWSCLRRSMGWGGVPLVVCAGLAVSHQSPDHGEAFPAEYRLVYGADRPFAPSLARKDMTEVEERMKRRILRVLDERQGRTFSEQLKPDPTEHVGIVTVAERLCAKLELTSSQREEVTAAFEEARTAFREQGRIHPRQLAGSAGCGTSGCHSEILAEWQPSAHRYASMDFVFQKVQENMAAELAPEATRYCAGCHDPIALFSGAKNVGNLTLSAEGADEGVSCLVCHSTVQTDVRGNADYTVQPPRRYIYEFRGDRFGKLVSDFLIRAYPRQHVASYSRPLYKTAESCGACHKQFIDEELNDFGWVQGQNQYDSWRKSRWHAEGDAEKSIGCRECHMPLVDSKDPAAGDASDRNRRPDDGKHRSHRFLAANQFIPRHHGLPGAEEHCALTEQWLRGEIDIPEIADRWTSGPVIRLEIEAPTEARPGQEVSIQAIVTNNKTGHDFPTGPLDMIEGWVEVTVTDEAGDIVFTSSRPDDRGYLINPRIVFKAEPIDRLGQLVGRHELWRKVGSRYKRALFPGFTDTTEFKFECPAQPSDANRQAKLESRQQAEFTVPREAAGTRLNVKATVWYCKFSAPFLDRLFGEDAALRSEVTDIAWAEATIEIAQDEEQASGHGHWKAQG